MPPAACSTRYNKDLTWTGVFAKSARSSVYSALILILAGYLLLFTFLISSHFLFLLYLCMFKEVVYVYFKFIGR